MKTLHDFLFDDDDWFKLWGKVSAADSDWSSVEYSSGQSVKNSRHAKEMGKFMWCKITPVGKFCLRIRK